MSKIDFTKWEIKTIEEIAEKPQYGFTQSASTTPTDTQFLRITDIQDKSVNWEDVPFCRCSEQEFEKFELKAGDLFFARTGATTGKSYLLKDEPPKAVFASYLIRLRIKNGYLPEYVSHFFQSQDYWQQIRGEMRGAAQPNINAQTLGQIKLPIPPTAEEQRHIVGRIKEYLSRIDEIKQLRQESQKEASHILQSAIEDSLKNVAGEEKTIGEVASIDALLIDPRKEEYLDLLHIGGANIVSGTGELIELKTAREENLISSKFVFNPGNVIYSKIRPYLRKVVRPDFQGICSADSYPLNPNTELITADYLFYLLLSRDFTNYAILASNRAGMPKVNRSQLFSYKFKLPSVAIQNQITAKLVEMRETSLNLAEEFKDTSEEINKITDSILRKAFAGEL